MLDRMARLLDRLYHLVLDAVVKPGFSAMGGNGLKATKLPNQKYDALSTLMFFVVVLLI